MKKGKILIVSALAVAIGGCAPAKAIGSALWNPTPEHCQEVGKYASLSDQVDEGVEQSEGAMKFFGVTFGLPLVAVTGGIDFANLQLRKVVEKRCKKGAE